MPSESKQNRSINTGSELPWNHPEVEMTFLRHEKLVETGEADLGLWKSVPLDHGKPTVEEDELLKKKIEEGQRFEIEVKRTRRRCPDCGYSLSIKSSCCPSGRMWVCLECAFTETFVRGK